MVALKSSQSTHAHTLAIAMLGAIKCWCFGPGQNMTYTLVQICNMYHWNSSIQKAPKLVASWFPQRGFLSFFLLLKNTYKKKRVAAVINKVFLSRLHTNPLLT